MIQGKQIQSPSGIVYPQFLAFGDYTGTTANDFLAPFANFSGSPTGSNESLCSMMVSRAGTLQNLQLGLSTGTSSGAATVLVRHNTGGGSFADSTITATIANGGRAASDTTHTLHVAAGDFISMKTTTTATFSASAVIWATLDFIPD